MIFNNNNLPPEQYDLLKIAGFDKHNAELDKLKEQAILKKQHQETITSLDTISNNIDSLRKQFIQHQEEDKKKEHKNKIHKRVSFIISSSIALGALITSIIALTL